MTATSVNNVKVVDVEAMSEVCNFVNGRKINHVNAKFILKGQAKLHEITGNKKHFQSVRRKRRAKVHKISWGWGFKSLKEDLQKKVTG